MARHVDGFVLSVPKKKIERLSCGSCNRLLDATLCESKVEETCIKVGRSGIAE